MKHLLVTVPLLLFCAPAWAQTVLHLSETARVTVRPDELNASVKVSAGALSAAEAQNRVNTLVAHALDQAKAATGVTVTTGNYQVWHSTQPEQWNAEQSIDLRGRSGDAVLRLVGVYQSENLALSRLGWQVAGDTARAAKAEATREALGHLRERADDAAGVLGMRFAAFRDVRLDGTPPNVGPAPRMMAAAAAALPSAQADDVSVEATVVAEILLQPGPAPKGK